MSPVPIFGHRVEKVPKACGIRMGDGWPPKVSGRVVEWWNFQKQRLGIDLCHGEFIHNQLCLAIG